MVYRVMLEGCANSHIPSGWAYPRHPRHPLVLPQWGKSCIPSSRAPTSSQQQNVVSERYKVHRRRSILPDLGAAWETEVDLDVLLSRFGSRPVLRPACRSGQAARASGLAWSNQKRV